MATRPTSPAEYLAALPDDRKALVTALRDTIQRNLPEGYEAGMQYGMLGWYVPHSRFPAGYHCDPKQPVPFIGLANQKAAVSLYLFCVYLDAAQSAAFADAWKATGKRLDMGKSCVRIKKLEDVPLDVVADTVRSMPVDDFLARYTAQIPASAKKA
jgi:hypothetical protein